MKTKYYYFLSIIIFIGGLIAFGKYVYSEYSSLNELLVQFNMPGEVSINIEKPGMYDIYSEDDFIKNSELLDSDKPSKPFTLIVNNDEGISMPIQRTEVPKKYSYKGRRGESVYEVNLPRAGKYSFLGVMSKTANKKNFTLILDKGFSDKRSKTVVTAQAILLFPIVASLILFLYAYSKSRL